MALMTDNSSKNMSQVSAMEAPYSEETGVAKFKRKAKESPFMVIGLSGCMFACAYGAYLFRKRGTTNPSLFLMQLRVTAQGTVIGCLMLGVSYSLVQRLMNRGSSTGGEDRGRS